MTRFYSRYKGAIDEVRVWNTPRSAEQISADYYKPLSGSLPAGLVTYYSFDNATPNSAPAVLPAGTVATLGATAVEAGATLVEEDRQLTSAYEWSLNGAVLANTATLLHEPQQSGTYQVRCINCESVCAASVPVSLTRFDGCYRVAASHNNKVLVPGVSHTVRLQAPDTQNKDQTWTLQPAGSGSFRLVSATTGRAMQYFNGSSIGLAPVSQTLAQQFTLVARPQASATPPDTYRFDPLDLVNYDQNNPLAQPQPHSLEANGNDELWAPLTTGNPDQFFVLTPATCPFTLPADCGIRIVAKDAQGNETDRLPRKPGTFNQFTALNLSVESLDNSSLSGAVYSWSLANAAGTPTLSNVPSLTAGSRGVYSLTLSAPGQSSVCEAYITLSATPCQSLTAVAGACSTITVNSPTEQTPLPVLYVGDQFNAGDYVVQVTEVAGGSGPAGYNGKGTIQMRLLNNISVPVSVVFTNARINECQALFSGTVVTQYDPEWGNIADVNLLGQRAVQDFATLQNELLEQLALYGGKPEEKTRLEQKIAELEALKAEIALLNIEPALRDGLVQESNGLSAYSSCSINSGPGQPGSANGRAASCTYIPWVKVAEVVGAATLDVLISYTFKWLELYLVSDTPKAYSDFEGVSSKMDFNEVTASALVSGLSTLIPVPTTRSAMLVMASGSALATVQGAATNVLTQWQQLSPRYATIKETYQHLNWGNVIQSAGNAAVVSLVTMAAVHGAKHPSIANFISATSRRIEVVRFSRTVREASFDSNLGNSSAQIDPG